MDRVAEYEEPLRVADWERMPPGDDRRPEWADERDTIVVFVDDDRHLQAGEEYPAGARRGGQPARPGTFPEFRTSRVALERDVDDPKGEAMARQEQAKYQREKGDVLGVYKDRVELTGAAGAPIEVEITNNIVETDDNE